MEDASDMIRIVLLIVLDTEEMRISESILVTHGLSSLPPPPTTALQPLQPEPEEGVLGSTPAHPPPWKPSGVLSSETRTSA